MPGLYFDSGVDKGFEKDIDRMNKKINKFSGNVQKENAQMQMSFGKLASAVGTFLSIQQLGHFAKQIVNIRGEFQQLEVAYETMLGSKEKADKLMAQTVELAATTPLSLTDVAGSSKQLMAYGFATEEITDTLRRLGDVASGLSIPLNDLTYLYGTTLAQGRVYARDVLQFSQRGIPLLDSLSKQFGVSKARVNELVSAGEVGFENVRIAIEELTNEGGKFNNLMEKQSNTVTGRIANMEDAFDVAMNKMGESNENLINRVIDGGTWVAENLEEITQAVGSLIIAVGTYKAAMLVANAQIGGSFKALGRIITKNPIGLFLAALGAATPYILDLVQSTDDLSESIQGYYNEQIKSIQKQKESNQSVLGLTDRYEELAKKTNRTKEEENELRKIEGELQKVRPDIIKSSDDFATKLTKIKEEGDKASKAIETLTKQETEYMKTQLKMQKRAEEVKARESLDEMGHYISAAGSLVGGRGKLDKNTARLLATEEGRDRIIELYDREINQLSAYQSKLHETSNAIREYKLEGKEVPKNLEREKEYFQDSVDALEDSVEAYGGAVSIIQKYRGSLLEIQKIEQKEKDIREGLNKVSEESAEIITPETEGVDLEKVYEQRKRHLENMRDLELSELRGLEDNEYQKFLITEKYGLKIAKLQKQFGEMNDVEFQTYFNNQTKRIIDFYNEYEKQIIDINNELRELGREESGEEDVNFIPEETQKDLDDMYKSINDINELAQTMRDVFSEVGGTTGDVLINITDMVSAMSTIKQAATTLSSTVSNLEKASVILAVIGAAMQVIQGINTTMQNIEEARTDAKLREISMNDIIISQLAQQEDLQNRIVKASSYEEANRAAQRSVENMKEYNRLLSEIANEQKEELTQTWIDGYIAAKGLNTEIEKAIGLMQVQTKKGSLFSRAEFESLLVLYPDLIDAQGKLNESIYDSVIANEQLDRIDKKRLTQLMTLQTQQEQAMSEYKGYVQDIFGEIGSESMKVFREMYETGDELFSKLNESFADMLERFTEDAIQMSILQPYVDNLNKEMGSIVDKYSMTGMNDAMQKEMIDTLSNFYGQMADLQDPIMNAYKSADKLLADAGFDSAFNSDAASPDSADANTPAGRIRDSITEETGSEMVGRLGAIMMSNQNIVNNSGEMLDMAVQHIVLMNKIVANTDYLPEIAENTRQTARNINNM